MAAAAVGWELATVVVCERPDPADVVDFEGDATAAGLPVADVLYELLEQADIATITAALVHRTRIDGAVFRRTLESSLVFSRVVVVSLTAALCARVGCSVVRNSYVLQT